MIGSQWETGLRRVNGIRLFCSLHLKVEESNAQADLLTIPHHRSGCQSHWTADGERLLDLMNVPCIGPFSLPTREDKA